MIYSRKAPAGGDRLNITTKIGNHVSIGSNATILLVSIADHTVIGAGSRCYRILLKRVSRAIHKLVRKLKNKSMRIPFVDPKVQYQSIKAEIDEAIASATRLHS